MSDSSDSYPNTSAMAPDTSQIAIDILKPLATRMCVRRGTLQITVGQNLDEPGIGDHIMRVSGALKTLGATHIEVVEGTNTPPQHHAVAARQVPRGVTICCAIKPAEPVRLSHEFTATGLDLSALADSGVNFPGSAAYHTTKRGRKPENLEPNYRDISGLGNRLGITPFVIFSGYL